MGRRKELRGEPPLCHPDRPYFASGKCGQCYQQMQRRKDPARKNAYNRSYTRSRPDKAREYQRRYEYGLEPSEYEAMVELQDGRCAICRQARVLCVDHCHTTGTVRGLLCKSCNVTVGRAEADAFWIEGLRMYVQMCRAIKEET